MNGYDGSLMGSITAVESYQKYYSLPENGAASTGIVFFDLPDRSNGGSAVCLDFGLARETLLNFYWGCWSRCW